MLWFDPFLERVIDFALGDTFKANVMNTTILLTDPSMARHGNHLAEDGNAGNTIV